MKNENGITLMALTVTIIVMLILAATTAYSLNSGDSVWEVEEEITENYYQEMNGTQKDKKSLTDEWGTVVNKRGVDAELNVT